MTDTWQDPPEYRDGGRGGGMAMPSLTPMVKRLMVANAAVFLVTFVLFLINRQTWEGHRGIATLFGIHPGLWRDWAPFPPIWQIFTWGFLHSFSTPMHILGNMLGLFFFGTMLEGMFGGRRVLSLYVTALLVSGLATLVAGLVTNSNVPTLGASGAILALIVAAATLRPKAQVIFIMFPMTLRTLALIVVGIDAFYMLLQISGAGGGGNVARLAHLTGAAWGFVAVKRGWIWKDPVESYGNWKEGRAEIREVEDTADVDRLLEKIHKEGIGSLNSSEKATLKRASKKV
ncbi:MAG: membrane associated rhomboid family serine protease [Planctomycetota bacterium]|jgi:membrane associated rhomboid family serine protease